MSNLFRAARGVSFLFLVVSAVGVAHAGPLYSSEADYGVFNNNQGVVPTSSYSSTTAPASFTNVQSTYTGQDSSGNSQTMTVTASAMADAQTGGILKSYSTLAVDNPYYNSTNTPYVNSNFTTNTSGSPDELEVYTQAQYYDPLTISATGPVSSLNVFVTLDGTISTSPAPTLFSGSPAYTQASIRAVNSTGSVCAYNQCGYGNVEGSGTYNQTYTLTIPVTANTANLGILLYTYLDFYLNSSSFVSNTTYTTTMDFSHTLQVTGIQGLNSSNNIVALNSVTGSGGFAYPLAPVPAGVPEPATMFLFGVGLLGLGMSRRKRAS